MIKTIIPAFFCTLATPLAVAQTTADTSVRIGKQVITLTELVVDNKLNVPAFINRVKHDTSFYKAFRNLRVLGFTAINDIRMNNGKGKMIAGLNSTTKQSCSNNCRYMDTLEEKATGDIYDENRQFNYYTAQLYASLFFTKDTICGDDNIVAGREFSTAGKTGMEKNKERLKMLFFNPGKRIDGLPFMSNKTAIYDDEMADRYDMEIDLLSYKGRSCYVFRQTVKPGSKSGVVVDEMTTWFDEQNFDILARNYSLSYRAGLYDFNVRMEVELAKYKEYLVPSLIRYVGNWKAIFKKRERGVFTATLFDFNN